MNVVAKRSSITLFSDASDHYSHRVRMVLAEKGVSVDVIDVDPANKPEDLIELNPYNTLPTLFDRDLVLYQSTIIMEYLDERFPHPPLMPVDPVSRSKSRLALFHIEKDWYAPLSEINSSDSSVSDAAKKQLQESILSTVEVFSVKPYFLSDEFSLVDCSIAPILWRLPYFGIKLGATAKPIMQYAERVFDRPSFRSSLSEEEVEMWPG